MKYIIFVLGLLTVCQGAVAQSLSRDGTGVLARSIYERAPQQPEILTISNDAGDYVSRIPFARLRQAPGDMRLLGANASDQIAFNVAARAHIKSARIVIRHVNSLSQEGLHPQLRVALNGHFLAQLPGVTGSGASISEITVGPEDIISGYNTLLLNAVQRYTLDCQDPAAAELWTDIDAARSFVELTYKRTPLDATLADLDTVISSGVGGIDALGIVTEDSVTDEDVRLGALASQGVADRMQYGLPKITHFTASDFIGRKGNPENLTNMDFIAVGTVDALAGIVRIDAERLQNGQSYLALRPSPFAPGHFMLVISGLDMDAVERGVIAFSAMNFPIDDAKEVVLAAVDIPVPPLVARNSPLLGGHVYSFRELGLEEQSLLGRERSEINLRFELPADNYFEEGAKALLSLDFAYGAGLEPGAAINIMVNGRFRRAIPLKNPDGEVNPGYSVALQTKDLMSGINQITFKVDLLSKTGSRCGSQSLEHLAFVLMGSSTIRIPSATHLAELPDLSKMSNTGFPYSGVETEPFAIVAADAESDTLASVWLLAAKLGQMHGAVFTDTKFSIDMVPEGMHVLLVGSGADLRYKLPADLRLSDRSRTVTARLISGSAGQVDVLTSRSLGANGLIVSGESPTSRNTLLTVITAQDPDHLLRAVEELVEPGHWSQLSGGAAVWREHPATFSVQPASKMFFVGDASASDRVRSASRRSPWKWIFAFGALLLGIVALLTVFARYMSSRAD